MTDPDAEFRELFKTEAAERLDTMAALLMDAERGTSDADAVHALLREAHTLKGAAGMVGLADVGALAHDLEDLLVPVRDAGAALPEALVETLLAGVDELRMRALGPRRPAETIADARIRVPADRIDRLLDLVGETMLHRRRLGHGLTSGAAGMTDELDLGDALLDELKDAAIGMRMQPVASIVGPLRRATREAARSAGKEVELTVAGGETELDRAILEELSDPLVHLLRNAVAHGIEPAEERTDAGKPPAGRVEVRAAQRAGLVEITVSDDGRGVPAELLRAADDGNDLADRLARPGLSTATEVTSLSGRGVGLDAVKRFAETHGGRLAIRSRPGRGTDVTLSLPFTLALVDVLLFERGATVFGLPIASVEQVLRATGVVVLGGRRSIDVRGEAVSLADVADLLDASAPAGAAEPPAILVGAGGKRLAVTCDRLIGEEDVVINGFEPPLTAMRGYLGSALLGDGRIALVLDPADLVRRPDHIRTRVPERQHESQSRRVLVVEDSFTVRELQRSILEAAGYEVTTAEDGRRALERLHDDESIGLVVSDVEMPELNGIELVAAIRADPVRASLPVVIVTSQGTEEDRRRGLDAGADAYIAKSSYDQETLLTTVGRLIGA
jgi:two-component system, chemotaxis family, sensor kinase CheA